MHFTYDDYVKMIVLLLSNGYVITDYRNYLNFSEDDKCAILRHDIDIDVDKACRLAEVEAELGVNSTFFVLTSSDLYNVNASSTVGMLKKIISLGHCIGLHFDESRYEIDANDYEAVINSIKMETSILEQILGQKVDCVSMHRPSKTVLDADLDIPGMVNSYNHVLFHDYKYLSDSRKTWRVSIADIIGKDEYSKLHILTHPFWYDDYEKDIRDSLADYIRSGNRRCYCNLVKNITGMEELLKGFRI